MPRLRQFDSCRSPLGLRPSSSCSCRRADAKHQGVIFTPQRFHWRRIADVGVRDESDTLCFHELETPIDDRLFQLEVRNAVREQSADAVGALKNRHDVAGTIELIGGGQAARAGAYDRDFLPGPF